MNSFSAITIIPARMGSSRFPGKPMKLINGMPMIGHVFHRAKLIKNADLVCVATCDNEIYDYIVSIGGIAIMTSNEHERCTDRTAEALDNLKKENLKNFSIVALVQGDEPMFNPVEIDLGIKTLASNDSHNIVNLMWKINSEDQFLDKSNLKVVTDRLNRALYISREGIPSNWKQNQRLNMFLQTGLIIFRAAYLKKYTKMDPTPLEKIESCDMLRVLENGDPIQMLEVDTRSISVDTPEDLEVVENLMSLDYLSSQYNPVKKKT
jgi:3-deoxy-manno-octulosonate cytidylyltransferase (CMP-KDO synthetase)